jgi:hypothetical protein
MTELSDASGCLTPAGVELVSRAPVGQVPEPLARHLASCARCQERVLAAGERPAGGPAPRREPPPPWRVWLVVALLVFAMLSIVITLRRLG